MGKKPLREEIRNALQKMNPMLYLQVLSQLPH